MIELEVGIKYEQVLISEACRLRDKTLIIPHSLKRRRKREFLSQENKVFKRILTLGAGLKMNFSLTALCLSICLLVFTDL